MNFATRCGRCKRPLNSRIAMLRGYGPDCAEIEGSPFSPVELSKHAAQVILQRKSGVEFKKDGRAVIKWDENNCDDLVSSFKKLEKFGVYANKDKDGNLEVSYEGTENFNMAAFMEIVSLDDYNRARRHSRNMTAKIIKHIEDATQQKAGKKIMRASLIAGSLITFAALSATAGAFAMTISGLGLYLGRNKKTKSELKVQYIHSKIKEADDMVEEAERTFVGIGMIDILGGVE